MEVRYHGRSSWIDPVLLLIVVEWEVVGDKALPMPLMLPAAAAVAVEREGAEVKYSWGLPLSSDSGVGAIMMML